MSVSASAAARFLPTPSVRRATTESIPPAPPLPISTHALREEGDKYIIRVLAAALISTHALREEGDTSGPRRRTWPRHFYPRPP